MASKLENPFVMSFFLPEHKVALMDHEFVKTLVPQPSLENDEFDELNRILMESIHNDTAVTVKWWAPVRDNLGHFKSAWGTVRVIPDMRQIKLTNDEDVEFIKLDRIVSVTEGYLEE